MVNKKTILFINTMKGWGGGEHWHFDWAMRLSKVYNVYIISNINSKLSQKAKENNLNLIEIKLTNFSVFNPFKWRKCSRIVRRIKPNSAIINLSRELKIFAPILKINKTKRIIYRKGSSSTIKSNLINNTLLNYFITDVLCNSLATKLKSFKKIKSKSILNKVKVIYNSIDLKDFDNIKIKAIEKNNNFIIKCVSRFSKEKNQVIFIELSKKLIEKNIPFEIHIAGDGEDIDKFKSLVNTNNLTKYIFVDGFIDNTKEYLSNTDVLVLPAKWIGFGFVKLEAMAMKIPIIAFNNSSNPETIIEKNTGFLIPEFDIDLLASRIEYLYKDVELKKSLGENARRLLEKEFELSTTKQKIISLID